MGVGMPQDLYLHEFGSQVNFALGDEYGCFLVGSALAKKEGWRDVDVRVILKDEIYDAMGLGKPDQCHHNGKWVALCLAFSALGKQMTGLPIDFQIQRQTEANKEFEGKERSALGLVPLRFKQSE